MNIKFSSRISVWNSISILSFLFFSPWFCTLHILLSWEHFTEAALYIEQIPDHNLVLFIGRWKIYYGCKKHLPETIPDLSSAGDMVVTNRSELSLYNFYLS